ncbi:MAG: hypothetical protein AB1489_19530 [Acidobacteriota bacterium]
MNRIEVDTAIEYYNQLIADKFADVAEELTRAIKAENLISAGRPISSVLRPYFIDETTYQTIQSISTLLMHTLRDLVKYISNNMELLCEFNLSKEEEMLLKNLPSHPSMIGRLDAFLSPQGDLRFLEYNSNPGDFTLDDRITKVFHSLEVMKSFGKKYQVRSIYNLNMTFSSIISAQQEMGHSGVPTVGIIGGKQAESLSELLLMIEFGKRMGCQVLKAELDQIGYRNQRLLIENRPLDIVFVLSWESLLSSNLKLALFDALMRGSVRLLQNPWDYFTIGQKVLFTILTDTNYAHLFKPDTIKRLSSYIPWTRKLREGKTSYYDNSIDLVPFVYQNRDRLVLKPIRGLGGGGVVLGWECDNDAWNAAIKRGLDSSYVVQERVAVGRETFPIVVDGRLSFEDYYFDMDPYVWQGSKVEGCLVRLSKTGLLNVSAGGGSMTPLFIVSKRI